jgi:hypothetical protein
VASTGLLGFNPYQKGVNIDFSSKPAAMAVQLIQHEAAKKEALDKYYKDYENQLTSTGMRNQDTDVFLNKLGEAKQYYLQNRDKILNPAKYGADAQAQYNSLLKGTQAAVSYSKQLAATDKVDAEHFYQAMQKGLDVPDGYLEAAQRARLPMNHPQFQQLDPYQYNFTKPFNEAEFSKTLTAGLTPSENKQYTPSKDLGYQDVKTTFAFDKDAKDVVRHKGEVAYQTIPGVTNMTNKVIANGQVGNFQNQFNELYPGQNINNAQPAQIAAAIGLSLTPHGKTISSREADNSFAMFKKKADYSHGLALQNIAANKAAQVPLGDPVLEYIENAKSGKLFDSENGNQTTIQRLNLPESITNDFKTKDYRNPIIGMDESGKVYKIALQKEIDPKTGKATGNLTNKIDWSNTEEAKNIRTSVVQHGLTSAAKAKLAEGGTGTLTTSKPSGKKDIKGF